MRHRGFPSDSASSLRCGGCRRFIRPLATPVASSRATREAGFTLIELLVVILVIAILAAMLFPAMSVAKRQSSITSTRALLKRVDNALQRFHAEVGCLPFQDHSGSFPQPNRLAWHLHHSLSASERTLLLGEAADAANRYDPAAGGPMVIAPPQTDPRETITDARIVHAAVANRQARQRARLAFLSGNTQIRGLKFGASYDFSGTALVPSATSQGMAMELLDGDIQAREINGDALIDRWGRPLIYVCPIVPGARGVWLPGTMGTSYVSAAKAKIPFTPGYYGLQALGRTPTTSLADSILTTAAEPYCFTFELLSSGPDRKTDAQRNHADNRDDISIVPYQKGLQ